MYRPSAGIDKFAAQDSSRKPGFIYIFSRILICLAHTIPDGQALIACAVTVQKKKKIIQFPGFIIKQIKWLSWESLVSTRSYES